MNDDELPTILLSSIIGVLILCGNALYLCCVHERADFEGHVNISFLPRIPWWIGLSLLLFQTGTQIWRIFHHDVRSLLSNFLQFFRICIDIISIPSILFFSLGITILHTEITTTMRVSIIITYSFAILFIIVSFFLFAKLNSAILHFEEYSIYLIAVAISNICFVFIDYLFLLLLTNNYAFFFLLFLIPLIYLLLFRNPCSNRISQHEFGEIISLKFIFAVFASLASIFAYLNEQTVLYILSPILTLILPSIIQLICISKKIGLKHYRMNDHIVYNSDLYKIKWDTKTAELQKKGNRNNILFSEIVCGDKTFPIDSYDRNAFDEYKLDSLTIQNGVFLDSNINLRTWKNPNEMKNVVLDCNCSRNGLRYLIHRNLCLNNLITTENCKSQVKSFNIVVSSSKLNLYFCSSSSNKDAENYKESHFIRILSLDRLVSIHFRILPLNRSFSLDYYVQLALTHFPHVKNCAKLCFKARASK